MTKKGKGKEFLFLYLLGQDKEKILVLLGLNKEIPSNLFVYTIRSKKK